jgi:hypothetical protein
MAHLLEKAPTGRAKCRGCEKLIAKGEWRFGERLPNPFDDKGGDMTHWFHVPCAAYRRPGPFLELIATTTEPIDDREALAHEAQLGVAHHRLPRAGAAERAATGRATCRHCKQLIEKDSWRISLTYYEDGRFSPSGFIHAGCAPAYLETPEFMRRVRYFSPDLSDEDAAELAAI